MQKTTHINYSFDELFEWGKKNPNRSIKLSPIEVSKIPTILDFVEVERNEKTLESLELPKFESVTLTPSGPLSAIAWMCDESYRNNPRQDVLREYTTKWQLKTDTLGRKKRKVHDGIASLANASKVKDWLEVFSGLAFMNNLQIIFLRIPTVENDNGTKSDTTEKCEEDEEVNNQEKHMYFSSNPVNWASDNGVWIVDYYGRWIAMPSDDDSLQDLPEWLNDAESHGWIVHWYEDTSLTKEGIVKELSSLILWQSEHAKLKKDILSKRLARTNAVKSIMRIVGM